MGGKGSSGGLEPGGDGVGCDGVHAARAEMYGVSAGRAVRYAWGACGGAAAGAKQGGGAAFAAKMGAQGTAASESERCAVDGGYVGASGVDQWRGGGGVTFAAFDHGYGLRGARFC